MLTGGACECNSGTRSGRCNRSRQPPGPTRDSESGAGSRTHLGRLEVAHGHHDGLALAEPARGRERAQAERDVDEERVLAVVDHDRRRGRIVVEQPACAAGQRSAPGRVPGSLTIRRPAISAG